MFLLRVMMLSTVTFVKGTVAMNSVEVEYCVDSDLNITCPRNHVILMEQALFGRMRTGGCIKQDKNIGCKVDVLSQMHELCSGRAYCRGRVPYSDFQKTLLCIEEMLAYVAVSYRCVGVVSTSGQQCQQHKPITIQDSDGYISSLTLQGQPSTRHSTCTFEIVVPKGQKVSLTYLNFRAAKASERQPAHCYVYTKEHSRKVPFCKNQFTKNVFESRGNQVYIDLKQSHTDDPNYFIINYSAVGCKNPEIPQETWFEREEAGVVVQCNHTNQKWHLVCRDSLWVGTMDNCTGGTSDKDGIVQKQEMFPFSLIIAVLVGIFIGILLGVALLCTFSVILRRRKISKDYYGTSSLSQGPDHSFMLQRKPYPYDHSYECTTTRNSSQPLSPGLISVTATTTTAEEECNPNCPYNSMVRGTEPRGKCPGRPQTGLRLWQETPSIIRDSEGELLQSHYWDNQNTTCACPGVEDTASCRTQRGTRENSLDKSEDMLTQMPSQNQQISALR